MSPIPPTVSPPSSDRHDTFVDEAKDIRKEGVGG